MPSHQVVKRTILYPVDVVRYLGVYRILLFLFIILPIVIFLKNIIISIQLYVGSSDEGYQLLQMQGRSQEGIKIWYQPYLDVLLPLWTLSGEQIKVYRMLGILFFLVCLSLSLHILIKIYKVSTTRGILFIAVCLSGLGINRYLLVTPGYQFIILVGSVSSLVLILHTLKILIDHDGIIQKHGIQSITLISILEVIIFSGRISSGLVFAFILSSLLILVTRRQDVYKILIIVHTPTVLVYTLNFNGWRDRTIFTITSAKKLDPKGYSISHEIIDILFPLSPILLAFLIGLLWTKIKLDVLLLTRNVVLITAFMATWFLGENRVVFGFLSLLFLILGRVAKVDYGKKFACIPLLVSLIPYLCVFGSNTPASGNFHNIVIGASVALIFYSHLFPKISFRNKSQSKSIFLLTPILVGLIFFYIGVTSGSTGYGKTLDMEFAEQSRKTSLRDIYKLNFSGTYSPSELPKLRNVSILDLSFFNPGIIYYLGGNPYPLSLLGLEYLYNLQTTLDEISKIDFSKIGNYQLPANFVLIQTKVKVDSSCRPLNNHTSNLRLAKLLQSSTLNSLYQELAHFQPPGNTSRIGLLRSCSSFSESKTRN